MKKYLFAAAVLSLTLGQAFAQTTPDTTKVKANAKHMKVKTVGGKAKMNTKKGKLKAKGTAAPTPTANQ